MVCITVSREDIIKIANGKEGRIETKNVPGESDNVKGFLKILDGIVKHRYLGQNNTKNDP